ncbi:MAG: apolipoprotein N-acyltransferase [Parachlamydiaceae bacterium]
MFDSFLAYLSSRETKKLILFLVSFLVVSFGQPAWAPSLGLIAASVGFAVFWSIIIDLRPGLRFGLSCLWFAGVQLVQLSWLISHPFLYIYALYFFLSLVMGAQFGLVGLLVTPKRVQSLLSVLGIAGAWVLMEWARLFFLSGFPFNPIGLALTANIYSLQSASLFGVYGLSFWVVLVNLCILRWVYFYKTSIMNGIVAVTLIGLPYVFGFWHYRYHEAKLRQDSLEGINVLLVQTAFPIEENLNFGSLADAVAYAQAEWGKIVETLSEKYGEKVDLIVLPEYVVPYGTYLPIYKLSDVSRLFEGYYSKLMSDRLPPLIEPLASKVNGEWMVTNAFWAQALANIHAAEVVIGLQDDQWVDDQQRESYSSAFYFWPDGEQGLRYEKRILVPMGEYIPFAFCRELAKSYGICGSFTCGQGAKVFPGSKLPFGVSICYEEIYGDLMRENRVKGAQLLVNLTSDVWYPGSRLPKQHFDHARLRTVECGIPLIRACNTGVTGAIDSLGRVVAIWGDGTWRTEWMRGALHVTVPTYHYRTLYARFGDAIVVSISLLVVMLSFLRRFF